MGAGNRTLKPLIRKRCSIEAGRRFCVPAKTGLSSMKPKPANLRKRCLHPMEGGWDMCDNENAAIVGLK